MIRALHVLELLSSLQDRSLVAYDETCGRYGMLDTIRDYAQERLKECNDRHQIVARHREFYMILAEESELALTGPDQAAWLDRLEVEHDNLRTALVTHREDSLDYEETLRTAAALWRFWSMRSYLSEGREALYASLSTVPSSQESEPRCRALMSAGILAYFQSDLATAERMYQESLRAARRLRLRDSVAGALNNLGLIALEQGDFDAAIALYQECLAVFRELGDIQSIASTLHNIGIAAYSVGDLGAARAWQRDSLDVRTGLGDKRGMAASLLELGRIAFAEGTADRAGELVRQSLALSDELSHQLLSARALVELGRIECHGCRFAEARLCLADSLHRFMEIGARLETAQSIGALGELAAAEGQHARAALLWSAEVALAEAIGAPQAPIERAQREPRYSAAREQIGDAAFELAWVEGAMLSLEQAADFAIDADDT